MRMGTSWLTKCEAKVALLLFPFFGGLIGHSTKIEVPCYPGRMQVSCPSTCSLKSSYADSEKFVSDYNSGLRISEQNTGSM